MEQLQSKYKKSSIWPKMADVNAMHETHVTPLMYAAALGHIEAMNLLLDIGIYRRSSHGNLNLNHKCIGLLTAVRLDKRAANACSCPVTCLILS